MGAAFITTSDSSGHQRAIHQRAIHSRKGQRIQICSGDRRTRMCKHRMYLVEVVWVVCPHLHVPGKRWTQHRVKGVIVLHEAFQGSPCEAGKVPESLCLVEEVRAPVSRECGQQFPYHHCVSLCCSRQNGEWQECLGSHRERAGYQNKSCATLFGLAAKVSLEGCRGCHAQ